MSTLKPAKRIAVIGAGPSGAITVDALEQEKAFDVIRVFERREGPGGCWLDDQHPPPPLTNLLTALSTRTADPPLPSIPQTLPATTAPPITQPRFAESSIYPYLETNVDDLAMRFSAEPIADERSEWSIAMHGADTPFRHWRVLRRYVEGLFAKYNQLVAYRTCVERCVKDGDEWVVTLRKGGGKNGMDGGKDEWWQERFDAVVVASGHFNVPYVPFVEGLEEFERVNRVSVLHSKMFRGRDAFKGKRVVIVGASVSAADIAFDLATHRTTKDGLVHTITLGHTYNPYFGDFAFQHPRIVQHPSIARVDAATRTVHLIDGTSITDVDHLIFGTGFSWSLPFLPQVAVRNNRVPGLYQHVVWREDPTLLFVGGVGAGLTFKIFEWQAVYAARLLAGRGRLPSVEEMKEWEDERVRTKGDGGKFLTIHPDFAAYFEGLRELAGEPTEKGEGRRLPVWEDIWFEKFMEGHERRKEMWKRLNAQARKEIEEEEKAIRADKGAVQSQL